MKSERGDREDNVSCDRMPMTTEHMAKKNPESRPPAKKKKAELLPKGYEVFLRELKEQIRTAQNSASLAVNHELISLYWHVGASTSEQQRTQGWGKSVVERLARDAPNGVPNGVGPISDSAAIPII